MVLIVRAPNDRSIAQHPQLGKLSYWWLLALTGLLPIGIGGWSRSAIAQTATTAPVSAAAFPMPPTADPSTSHVLIVNPVTGNDATADGSTQAAFKTITQALQQAQPGTVILLSSGTYSQETGETFPLQLKPDVTLKGDPDQRGQTIIIQGSGWFISPTSARQRITVLGADRAVLSGVTVTNPDPQGYGLWIESTSPTVTDNTFTANGHDGISVTGSGAPLIQNNYFYQNGANGITLYGRSRAEVRENIFEQTGFAINVNQKATPLIVGNRITQNKDGIVVQANAQPVLRNNSIESNQQDGLVAIAQARPNLGTAAEPGGNSFRNNGQLDVNAKKSNQSIPAFGNDFTKTAGTLDLTGASPVVPLTATETPSSASRSLALPLKPVAASDRASKAMSAVPSAATAAAIPFGQALGTTAAVPETPIAPAPNPTSTTAATISADSFPAPGAQPAPAIAATTANSTPDPGFPVPAALAGVPPQLPQPRPIQVVNVALVRSTPAVQRRSFPVSASRPVSQPIPVRSSVPLPVPMPRPALSQPTAPPASIPIPVPAPSGGVRPTAVSRPILTMPRPLLALRQPLQTPIQQPGPLPQLSRRVSVSTRAIEIPVPAPESRSPAPTLGGRSIAATTGMLTQGVPLASGPLKLLPVPDPNAPIGNVGRSPTVEVYRNSSQSATVAAAARSVASLRYRVVVESLDTSQAAQLRSMVPNAFQTSVNGRSVIQVGAFGDRVKADQLMQTLLSQGIPAKVEALE